MSSGENALEFANSIIHGLGIVFGLAAIPFLAIIAVKYNQLPVVLGASVYALSFLMVFTSSTIYHGLRQSGIKKIFEKLDHISIYFLIAGTYTPLIMEYMHNTRGFTMLYILWGLALAGTVFKSIFGCRYDLVSTIIYVLMGWMLVWTGGSIFAGMPSFIFYLVLGGGILYSIGVTFYIWKRWKWHHAIWHAFVLTAAICHFTAIYFTLGPDA